MKNILVTGGMGFIGSHLVHALLENNMNVWVLDKNLDQTTYYDISDAQIIEGNVLSQALLNKLIKKVDTCFHLAALASVPLCNKDWIFSHKNNVLAFNGLLNELKQARKKIKLVYASSSAVYGDAVNGARLHEDMHCQPNSPYGADKVSNEVYAHAVYKAYGFPSIGLRFFNVYGPGQTFSNPYSGVISRFQYLIDQQQRLTIFGDGEQTRDFIYVGDVIKAILLAGLTPFDKTGVWNVCTGQSISIKALAEYLMNINHVTVPIKFEAAREGDAKFSVGDPGHAAKDLGFTAEQSLEAGLNLFSDAWHQMHDVKNSLRMHYK